MAKGQLREALNQFTIIGTVKENNLRLIGGEGSDVVLKDKNTGQPYRAMAGELVIKTGEDNEHEVSFFAREMTKDNKVSKLFKAYETAMNTYVSEVDVAEAEGEEGEPLRASRVAVQGEIGINDYYSGNELKSFPQLNGKFFNSSMATQEDKAEFDLEIFLDSVSPELDRDGIDTGRLNVRGVVPGYGGRVSPLDFKVTDEHGVADYMGLNFKVDDTIQVWGELVNTARRIEKEKSGFGKSKTEVTYEYNRELLIIGGEEFPLDEDAFAPEDIRLALQERDNYLEQLRQKSQSKGKKRTAGFSGSKPSTGKRKEDYTPDSIPF